MVNILDYAKEAVIEKVFSFNILFKKILKFFSLPKIKYDDLNLQIVKTDNN